MAAIIKYESDLAALTGVEAPIRGYVRTQADSSEVIFMIPAKNKHELLRIRRDQTRYVDWLKTKLPGGTSVKLEVF
jgi:RNase adaptor protein for sRNA GlmZ degradation